MTVQTNDQAGAILYILTCLGIPLRGVLSTNSEETIPGILLKVPSVVRIWSGAA